MTTIIDHLKDPLYRNSAFVIANNIVIAGSGFVFWLIAARTVDPATLGIATAIIGAITLVATVSKVGIDFSLLSVLPRSSPLEARLFLEAFSSAALVASLVGAAVFLGGTKIWARDLAPTILHPGAAALFVLLSIICAVGFLLDYYLTARRRPDLAFWKNALHAVLRIGSLLALGRVGGAIGIVVASIGSMLIAAMLALRWLREMEGFRLVPRLHLNILRRGLASTSANYLASLVMAVPLAIGSLIIIAKNGPGETARFYLLWLVGSIALLAPSAFGQTFLVGRASGSRVRSGTIAWSTVLLGGLGVVLIGPVLLHFIGKSYGDGAAFALLPYALTAIPSFYFQDQLAHVRAEDRHLPLVVAPTMILLVFIAGVIVVPGSVEVAGWAWLAANVSGALVLLLMRPRHPRPGESA